MPAESFSVSVLRPFDLLHLTFHFQNLQLDVDDPKNPLLIRGDPDEPALIIVRFPPQHVQEEAFFEAEPQPIPSDPDPIAPADPPTEEIPPHPPVRALISGPSRLVFRLPDDVTSLPYTLAGLLDWQEYELVVNSRALPPTFSRADFRAASTDPQAPTARETALEIPYRLFLSPNKFARWIHSLEPVTRNGRSELWHTRLATLLDDDTISEGPAGNRTVRAIWTPGYGDKSTDPSVNDTDGFRASLTPLDRTMLVRESSDFTLAEEIDDETLGGYIPAAIPVNRLMLTSQGAWMDVQGAWDIEDEMMIAENMDITAWRHITTQGRDQYVRVVYAGYLYPFGHRASLIKVTERKFQSFTGGAPSDDHFAAYLRQRLYIVVREPVKQYAAAQFVHGGREQPLYHQIRIHTRVTPNLDLPQPINGNSGIFWVRIGGQDFQFDLSGRDVDGRSIPFSGALIFIRASQISPANVSAMRSEYRSNNDRRRCLVPGVKLAYAPRNSDKPGDAALLTEGLIFDTQETTQPGFELFDFTPILDNANVRVPAIEQLIGSQTTQKIRLFQGYIENGLALAGNKATVFAELLDEAGLPAPAGLGIPTDKAGGLSTPNLDMTGLSQHLGPVASNLNDLAAGNFDPAAFFNRLDARLLGGITLKDIVQAVLPDALETDFDSQFPKLVTKPEPPPPDLPEKLITTLDWHPAVQSFSVFVADNTTDFNIQARIEQKLNGNNGSSFDISGALTNFRINFLDVIEIRFKSLSFSAAENKKLDISADIVPIDEGGIKFLGPLEFLNELRRFIPADGFIDPPFLDVTPSGAAVGFTQALPPLAVGVFSLQNVNLGAVLNIPFTGAPVRFRFNFSERHSPFIVTVGIFGGGGFFALALGLDGIETIEAALEFGGNVSLNLGVASGGVYVMAGVYFKYQDEDQVQLSGYFRAGGSLSVLGLITVSLEFYLELSYLKAPGGAKVWGRATLTVKVEVLFFSASVKLTVERTFSGTSGDPTFAQMLTPGDWRAYAAAFA